MSRPSQVRLSQRTRVGLNLVDLADFGARLGSFGAVGKPLVLEDDFSGGGLQEGECRVGGLLRVYDYLLDVSDRGGILSTLVALHVMIETLLLGLLSGVIVGQSQARQSKVVWGLFLDISIIEEDCNQSVIQWT